MFKDFKNEQMKKALAEMKQNRNQVTINKMLQVLLTTQFLAPAIWDKDPQIDENGQMVFEPNTKFQLMIIETDKHDCFFPMFTDMEELKKWNKDPNVRSLVVTFKQFISFVEIAKKDIKGVVFDPFGANVPLSTDYLLKVKSMVTNSDLQENKIKKGDHVYMREPVMNVDDLRERLCECAKADSEISAIYLKERVEEGKPSHWFIIVETQNEDINKFETIGRTCHDVRHDKEMEFMFASTSLSQSVISNTTPVYKK